MFALIRVILKSSGISPGCNFTEINTVRPIYPRLIGFFLMPLKSLIVFPRLFVANKFYRNCSFDVSRIFDNRHSWCYQISLFYLNIIFIRYIIFKVYLNQFQRLL